MTSAPTSPDTRRNGAARVGDAAADRTRPVSGPTVIVGYDGSSEARVAFEAALDRGGPDGRVVAVHVTSPPSTWLGSPYYDELLEVRLRAGEAVLDELRALYDDDAAQVSLELFEGDPAEVLLHVAEVRDADEIVVGSRGLGRLRAMLGSVSQALVRASDRPVLIIPFGAA